ncbi:hypothetical protein [Streptomyces sp. NPDC091879]|uniref:hypothetical protein n=1 Tax=Streptomyces sp. NPDC091879 TaxID=3366006 RepID=UPI0038125D0D
MWKLRYWEPGQPRPTVIEVYDDRGIGADLQHAIDEQGCTRVEAVRRGHPADPKPKPKPVKVQRIEWERDEKYPKGERWLGRVNGKDLATVVHQSATWGGRCSYRLDLGDFGDSGGYSTNAEGAKRAAQTAFTKLVRSLIVGEN